MSEYDDTERGWLEGRDSRTAQERLAEDETAATPDVEGVLSFDEREVLGERLMLAMTCNHGSDYFGTGAVCETCWTNVQRVGRIVERILADRVATARRGGADAALAPVEALRVELIGKRARMVRGWFGAEGVIDGLTTALAHGRDAAKGDAR